jgi:hypothetical protein
MLVDKVLAGRFTRSSDDLVTAGCRPVDIWQLKAKRTADFYEVFVHRLPAHNRKGPTIKG